MKRRDLMFFKKKGNKNEDINEAIDVTFDSASDEINDQLEDELYISLVGDVNAGKSSTMISLLEDELVTVCARQGETNEVDKIHHNSRSVFVYTSGLDDFVTTSSAKSLACYKKCDVT